MIKKIDNKIRSRNMVKFQMDKLCGDTPLRVSSLELLHHYPCLCSVVAVF